MAKFVLKEFKDFIAKGNVIDLAIGVIIGAAFGKIIDSMVKDVITPVIAAVVGQPDFSGIKWGPVLIGKFLNEVVSFLIIAFVLFLIVKAVNKMKRPEAVAPSGPTDVDLLTEIRDLMKAK